MRADPSDRSSLRRAGRPPAIAWRRSPSLPPRRPRACGFDSRRRSRARSRAGRATAERRAHRSGADHAHFRHGALHRTNVRTGHPCDRPILRSLLKGFEQPWEGASRAGWRRSAGRNHFRLGKRVHEHRPRAVVDSPAIVIEADTRGLRDLGHSSANAVSPGPGYSTENSTGGNP